VTAGSSAPDYSRPCVDVERRDGTEWQWGVTHTVRSEPCAPMVPGREYRLTVKVQRAMAAVDADATFAALYARATTIAVARCHDVARDDDGVHQRMLCHAWRTVALGDASVAFAMVMMGLMRPAAGEPPPLGEAPPAERALMTSGGATMEEMQRWLPQRATEVLVEFDHRRPAAGASPAFMYSYGERVATDAVDGFEPFVRRAEHHARAHLALDRPGPLVARVPIVARQWYLADQLVTVELHLQPDL
jgi:hypothetical protein